jgi:hypothetical protein
MPTLDWLNRASAFNTAARVPYRLLEQVSIHASTAHSPSFRPEVARLVGERWQQTTGLRFAMVEKALNGMVNGMDRAAQIRAAIQG